MGSGRENHGTICSVEGKKMSTFTDYPSNKYTVRCDYCFHKVLLNVIVHDNLLEGWLGVRLCRKPLHLCPKCREIKSKKVRDIKSLSNHFECPWDGIPPNGFNAIEEGESEWDMG